MLHTVILECFGPVQLNNQQLSVGACDSSEETDYMYNHVKIKHYRKLLTGNYVTQI